MKSFIPLVLVLAAAGCRDANEPSTGALRVSVVTTGGDLDLNGYVATADGGKPLAVPANGVAVIPDLPTGSHDIALTDVAPNCSLSGPNPGAATVRGGDTTEVDFAIACVATGVRVTTSTTGIDLDADGYAVSVDGAPGAVVSANGSVEITRLAVGSHTVALTAGAVNCAVAGDSIRPVSLVLGEIATVAFDLTCIAATGVIEVAVTTSGVDFDPHAYTVQVDGGTPRPLGVAGIVRFDAVGAGNHTVSFAGAAGNCTIAGENPRIVSVTVGGTARDTTRTTFALTCAATTGTLRVTAVTTGGDIDPDGYRVGFEACGYVDDETTGTGTYACGWESVGSLGVNGSVNIPWLSPGERVVLLDDVSPNCVAANNPRSVNVSVGDTVELIFPVACVAWGNLQVAVTTTGADLDPNGYSVVLGSNFAGTVAANGSLSLGYRLPGDYAVGLSGVAANCTVGAPNPRTVAVLSGETATVTFVVSCVALGAIQVTATTTGADLDADGYTVAVSGGPDASLPTNGMVSFHGLVPGDYTVTLMGAARNCTVGGANPRPVIVSSGATTAVAFDVTCAGLGSIRVTATTTGTDLGPNGYTAATSSGASAIVPTNGTVTFSGLVPGDYLVTLNGTTMNCDLAGLNPRPVTVQSGGTVSVGFDLSCTAATVLAVTRFGDIYTLKSNGADFTQLTTHSAYDAEPAWSPDGSKIAFRSDRDGTAQIYVMNANGSNQTRLTTTGGGNYSPTWSPDGTRIAFVSGRTGNADIYVMEAGGANQVNVTNTLAWDGDPAWGPDGRIAFASQRDDGNPQIYLMDGNGSDVTRLTHTGVSDVQPSWSPDGRQLVISREMECDEYFDYCVHGLVVVNADGSGESVLVASGSAVEPVWSPEGQWIAFGVDGSEVKVIRADGSRVVVLGESASQPAWRR